MSRTIIPTKNISLQRLTASGPTCSAWPRNKVNKYLNPDRYASADDDDTPRQQGEDDYMKDLMAQLAQARAEASRKHAEIVRASPRCPRHVWSVDGGRNGLPESVGAKSSAWCSVGRQSCCRSLCGFLGLLALLGIKFLTAFCVFSVRWLIFSDFQYYCGSSAPRQFSGHAGIDTSDFMYAPRQ